MQPPLHPDEIPLLRRRLLYARWLYEKGLEESEHHDELSHLVAITHFHNAVEIVMQTALACYGRTTPAQMRTLTYVAMVEELRRLAEGTSPPIVVGGRSHLVRLSEMRSNIMHQAHRYSRAEVEWARNVSRRFLGDTVRDFFGESLYEMSMADLVENVYVRDLLRKAQEHKAQDRYEQCVAVSVLVVHLAGVALAQGWRTGERRLRDVVRWEMSRMRRYDGGFARDLEQVLERIADSVVESEDRLSLLSSGVDREAALTFLSWRIRAIDVTHLGSCQREYTFTKHVRFAPAEKEASLALRVATDAALNVQALGLGPHMTRRFGPFEVDAIGNWEGLVVDIPPEVEAPDSGHTPS